MGADCVRAQSNGRRQYRRPAASRTGAVAAPSPWPKLLGLAAATRIFTVRDSGDKSKAFRPGRRRGQGARSSARNQSSSVEVHFVRPGCVGKGGARRWGSGPVCRQGGGQARGLLRQHMHAGSCEQRAWAAAFPPADDDHAGCARSGHPRPVPGVRWGRGSIRLRQHRKGRVCVAAAPGLWPAATTQVANVCTLPRRQNRGPGGGGPRRGSPSAPWRHAAKAGGAEGRLHAGTK